MSIMSKLSAWLRPEEEVAYTPITPVEIAQSEFFAAQRELRQAQQNFDSAEPGYAFTAIDDLNIAQMRVDSATRKLKLAVGVPLNPREVDMQGAVLRKEADQIDH